MRDFKLSGPAWFDASPEPVILAHDGDTAYYNAAAAALAERSGWTLKEETPLPEPLRAIDGVGVQTLELAGEHWVCRTERLKAGLLICLTLSPSSITVPLERLAQLAERMRLPLGSLIGVSQLLAQSDGERTEEKTSQYQSIQRKSYYTLLRMLNTLETLGSLSDGRRPFQGEPLDLGGLCAEVVRRVQSVCDEAGCAVELRQNGGNLLVQGEDDLLRQMLYHLISNAIRAAGDGGRVTLELEKCREKDRRWVRLVIWDSGSGFKPEQLARAFDPAQGAAGLSDRSEGLGLGLVLCKRVAERHGGRLAVMTGASAVTAVELPLCDGLSFGALHSPSDLSGGINETLVQLSDVLPWQCFAEEE